MSDRPSVKKTRAPNISCPRCAAQGCALCTDGRMDALVAATWFHLLERLPELRLGRMNGDPS